MIRYRKDKVAILRLMSGTAHSEPLWRLQGFVRARTFNNNPTRVRLAERKQVFSQQPLFKLASPPQCAGHTLLLLMRRSSKKTTTLFWEAPRQEATPTPTSSHSLSLPYHSTYTTLQKPLHSSVHWPLTKLSQTSMCPPTLQHHHAGLGRVTGD